MRRFGFKNNRGNDGHDNFIGKAPDDSRPMEHVLGSKDTLGEARVEGGDYGSKHGLDDGVQDATWNLLNNM